MSRAVHAIEAPPSSGEVRFRREDDRLCVDHASPVMWFARHVLEYSRRAPDVGLSFDGRRVSLPCVQWAMDLEANRPHLVP